MQASSAPSKSAPPVAADPAQVLRRELDRRERVLHLVRHLARHLRPGGQAVAALEVAALAVEVAGHLVEGLDERRCSSSRLVGGHARRQVALGDAPGGRRERADRARDAAGHASGRAARPGRRNTSEASRIVRSRSSHRRLHLALARGPAGSRGRPGFGRRGARGTEATRYEKPPMRSVRSADGLALEHERAVDRARDARAPAGPRRTARACSRRRRRPPSKTSRSLRMRLATQTRAASVTGSRAGRPRRAGSSAKSSTALRATAARSSACSLRLAAAGGPPRSFRTTTCSTATGTTASTVKATKSRSAKRRSTCAPDRGSESSRPAERACAAPSGAASASSADQGKAADRLHQVRGVAPRPAARVGEHVARVAAR